ncbi:hypothetical protein T484DRAFT_1872882, partial [Baffinella frigidus]
MRCNKQAELPAPAHECTTAHPPGTALHQEGKPGSEQAPPGFMAATSELAPCSAFSTEHMWELAPCSEKGNGTEHTLELAPCSEQIVNTEHTCELAPCSDSAVDTEHTCELAPCNEPRVNPEHTSELAPCSDDDGNRWRATLAAAQRQGAASMEFLPQQATIAYPLPTLEPRDVSAPQGEPAIAAQAELDLQMATFPELVWQYFSAEYQTGIFVGGTFPLQEVDYETFATLRTAPTATATETTIPV